MNIFQVNVVVVIVMLMCSVVLEYGLELSSVHSISVAGGGLYSCLNFFFFSKIFKRHPNKSSAIVYSLVAFLKLPLVLLVLFWLSKQGAVYLMSALAGMLTFVPGVVAHAMIEERRGVDLD